MKLLIVITNFSFWLRPQFVYIFIRIKPSKYDQTAYSTGNLLCKPNDRVQSSQNLVFHIGPLNIPSQILKNFLYPKMNDHINIYFKNACL